MKKSFWLLIVLSIGLSFKPVPANDGEEGIRFFKGTWSEALQKAGKEKKYIFLDISTSWCGYCKLMKKNTFSVKRVGDYFNKNFINVELDGEKEDGLRLVKKFGVTGYPTVFILDKNEMPLLTSEGYHDPDDLLEMIQSAVKGVK